MKLTLLLTQSGLTWGDMGRQTNCHIHLKSLHSRGAFNHSPNLPHTGMNSNAAKFSKTTGEAKKRCRGMRWQPPLSCFEDKDLMLVLCKGVIIRKDTADRKSLMMNLTALFLCGVNKRITVAVIT